MSVILTISLSKHSEGLKRMGYDLTDETSMKFLREHIHELLESSIENWDKYLIEIANKGSLKE